MNPVMVLTAVMVFTATFGTLRLLGARSGGSVAGGAFGVLATGVFAGLL